MSTVRRRVLRPRSAGQQAVTNHRDAARQQRRREQLAKERAMLDRWMKRLKRAFHAVEKQQQRVARLERQLNGSADN